MRGTIEIELTRKSETRETLSDLPDLGHDAYWFAKKIRELVWTSKSGGRGGDGGPLQRDGGPRSVSGRLGRAVPARGVRLRFVQTRERPRTRAGPAGLVMMDRRRQIQAAPADNTHVSSRFCPPSGSRAFGDT